MKSGAEGVAAAVRIARASTGRSVVIGAGYFGWLDWWSTAAGVPAGAHEDFRPVPFDDPDALADATRAAGDRLAAIIIEPVIERLPSREWLAQARRACDSLGAVLILDEMKTGFRLRTGGYQEYAGVDADLAVFGKAMANGFPLSAVVGRERIKVPAGEFDTVRVARLKDGPEDKRSSEMWLAPSLGYIPVRMLATDKDGSQLDQVATKISGT